jgi:hypothetical protein
MCDVGVTSMNSPTRVVSEGPDWYICKDDARQGIFNVLPVNSENVY